MRGFGHARKVIADAQKEVADRRKNRPADEVAGQRAKKGTTDGTKKTGRGR